MRTIKYVAATLGLLALGLSCRWSSQPEVGFVAGIIRYPSGAPVFRAKVSVVNGETTFSDATGLYLVSVKAAHGDTLTVVARDGYTPGMSYGETHSGGARIVVHRSRIVLNIVLDEVSPI